jgi:hypothetical protein
VEFVEQPIFVVIAFVVLEIFGIVLPTFVVLRARLCPASTP